MQALESLKRQIESAQDLESVVRTMKTLAAVSIRQYETAVESLAHYHATVEMGLRMLLWQSPELASWPHARRATRIGAIVFGSDQGMCGQFNEQIEAYAVENLRLSVAAPADWSFFAVGARIAGRLEDAGVAVDRQFPLPGAVTGITPLVQDLLIHTEQWRTDRQLGRVMLFYNRRHSASSYRQNQYQLLPIDPKRFYRLKQRVWPSRTLPLFTLDRDRLYSVLVQHHLFVTLFRSCAESLASENASRIASMQSAERNIQERLDQLHSGYHHLRQTSITEELLDVVTGFEALTTRDPRDHD